ncbi:MAG: DUF937 domain-containing protein [Oscillospiraceae bacterium]|nr:DUF937 domain-containing protein [Oscillospiraceae bacterium]
MNLLSLLLKSMLTDSSITALAKKTGLSSAVLKKLVPLAIPLLIKFMTNNASSQSGAQSLLGALTQHTNKKTLAEQIDEADTADGQKIIGHIFGSQSDAAISSLAQQAGLSTQDVSTALSGMAPAVLSGLSAATSSASAAPKVDLSDGFDLTDLMGMFAGAQAQSQPSAGGLLSGLLGGGSNSLGGGLLGSLLGGSASQADNDSSVNGMQLLSLLTGR